MRTNNSVSIHPVNQNLTDDQTEKSTEVRRYHPEGNCARRWAQYAADSHRCHIARSNE